MFKKGRLVAMIFALLFMVTGSANAGQGGMATGDVMVFKNDAWLHWVSFVAQEMGDEPFGTGFINHKRLNDEGTEILRQEQSQIRYVIVEGNEAWFTGPIVYDSADTEPARWFVVYVQDNGQSGNGNDLIWFTRVTDENEAQNLLGSYSWGTYPPDDLENGDIKVYYEPIYVPSDYLTIQSAIDAAASGDAILVNPGTYPENINFNGKDIFLQSTNGADSTIIAPPSGGTVVTIGPNGEILGFTIRNGSEYFGAGMSVSGSGSHIVQNIFESNHQMGGGYGAAIGGNSASPLIERNIFRGNDCDTQWLSGVVSFINSSSPRIVNNIFVDNPCRAINFTLPAGAMPETINNTIVRNSVGIYIARYDTSQQIYRNNIIVDNGIGLELVLGTETDNPIWEYNLVYNNNVDYEGIISQTGILGNISSNPLFVAPLSNDFHLTSGSSAIEAGTSIGAPNDDFDGEIRPGDGNNDNIVGFDIGADEYLDNDLDGLPNYLENKICTDPYNADTDDDGIMDGDEDCDHDGLTNLEEFQCGSNPVDPYSRCLKRLPWLMLLLD